MPGRDAAGRSRPRDLRASNADREAYADILETAYADGRLDAVGLEYRSGRVWSATTMGELDDVVIDLLPPETPLPQARPSTGTERRPGSAWRLGAVGLTVGVTVVGLIVVTTVVRSFGDGDGTDSGAVNFASDMFTADGIQQVVADLAEAAGTAQFLEIGFYGEYAIASASGGQGAQRLARLDWRDGDVAVEPGQATPDDVEGLLYDVATDVDFPALAVLARAADEQTGMTEVDSLSLHVNRASHTGDHQIEARVNLSNDYQYASIVADHAGTVVTIQGPGVEPDPSRFLVAAGIEDALEAVTTRIGGSDVVEIIIYGEYVITAAPPEPGAPVVASFSYRGGTTAIKDATIPSQPEDLAAALFSLDELDPDVIATLVSEAPDRSGSPTPRRRTCTCSATPAAALPRWRSLSTSRARTTPAASSPISTARSSTSPDPARVAGPVVGLPPRINTVRHLRGQEARGLPR